MPFQGTFLDNCVEEVKDHENTLPRYIGMFNLLKKKNKVKVLLYGNNNLHVASLL